MSWLTGILGAIFKAIVGGFVEDFQKRRAEQAHREAGQLEQKAADQDEVIAAQRRAADAAARPKDTAKRIGDGTL